MLSDECLESGGPFFAVAFVSPVDLTIFCWDWPILALGVEYCFIFSLLIWFFMSNDFMWLSLFEIAVRFEFWFIFEEFITFRDDVIRFKL